VAYHKGMNALALSRPSTVALQAIAALSGALLFAWVLAHLLGNLTLFAGAAAADGYAQALRRTGPLLWLVRGGVLLAAAAHIWAVVRLARRAPPGARWLHRGRGRAATFASRSMRAGGALLALFVVYHLLHLTGGQLHPDFLPGHVHHNVTRALAAPLAGAVYLAACALLGLHLGHGLWALGGSLGLGLGRDPRRARKLASVVGAAVALAFASLPLAALAGVLR
jgi:succinate dehydrogenase / fumarate reductase, cytochrome b subunit